MKKVVLVVLLFAILFNVSAVVYASDKIYYSDYAERLSKIGVFKGTGSGFELEREPTRLEGLIMLIRLLGKEADANRLAGEASMFSDVPDWGKGYVNYAYKFGLTKGVGNGLFGAYEQIDGKSYITFLLRALGYDDSEKSKDFVWNDSVDFAKSIGLLDEDLYFKIVSNKFIRDYVAKASYNALQQPLKNSSVTLVQKLVATGAITQAQADSIVSPGNDKTSKGTDKVLSSVEIGKLAKAVVRLEAVGYDGTQWTGSGFYVSIDGNIVTNYHVITGAKSLRITESDGGTYTGDIRIIGYDEDHDIAVLDINKTVDLYLDTGNSDSVVIGENVYAIGYPLGLQVTVSDGIVSSLWSDGTILTTAPISHGNSGGVLLNDKGLAIGITYAGIEEGENLGLAIPIKKYANLSKNFSLTLSDLRKLTGQVPLNATVDQVSRDEVSIYWDPIAGADYYCVYTADSINGDYTMLVDDTGSGKWQWHADSCITASGLVPGNTYYFKVTAVMSSVESMPSEVVPLTLVDITYEHFKSAILDEFGVLKCGEYTTAFSDVNILDTDSGGIHVMLYLKSNSDNYFEQFLNIMMHNRSELEQVLAEIASVMSRYYDKEAAVSVVYFRDNFTVYPDAFSKNAIYSDTIEYNPSTGYWSVFYPYVYVEIIKDTYIYDSAWAY